MGHGRATTRKTHADDRKEGEKRREKQEWSRGDLEAAPSSRTGR